MSIQLEMTRTIKANQKQVFQAFTEADILKKWFAPGDMTVPRAEMDKKVCGNYLIEMQDTKGDSHTITGTIQLFEPYEKISYTWKWASPDSVETLVTFTFKDQGEETEVHLLHENFLTDEARDLHQQGWEGCLNNINKAI